MSRLSAVFLDLQFRGPRKPEKKSRIKLGIMGWSPDGKTRLQIAIWESVGCG